MHIVPRKKQQENSSAMTLRDAMNQLLEDSFWDPWHSWGSALAMQDRRSFVPRVDVSEDDKQITVAADIPGYDPKDIDVTVDDSVLTIQGHMHNTAEKEDEKKQWYRRECCSGSFQQQFTLPPYSDEQNIRCSIKNGRLSIAIPKKKQSDTPKGRKLSIEAQ